MQFYIGLDSFWRIMNSSGLRTASAPRKEKVEHTFRTKLYPPSKK